MPSPTVEPAIASLPLHERATVAFAAMLLRRNYLRQLVDSLLQRADPLQIGLHLGLALCLGHAILVALKEQDTDADADHEGLAKAVRAIQTHTHTH